MKLSVAQVPVIEEQLGVKAVPDDHVITDDLKNAFGEHTFFLDVAGLNIVEPDPTPGSSNGAVLKVASWADEDQDKLLGHQPEVLPITVDLEDDAAEPSAKN